MTPTYDKHLLQRTADLLQKAAGKAGEILSLTEWNDDLKFLLIWSQLSNLFGGDEKLMNHWMQTPNKHLDNKVPANLITTNEGTEQLISFLEWYSQ